MTTVAVSSSPNRTGGWLLAGFQFGYAAWYALCIAVTLAHAREFSGHWYLPARDDEHTAVADIWSGWAWSGVATWTISSAPLLAGFALFATMMLILLGYASGRRRLTVALVAGAAISLATLLASVSPAGQSISGWLTD